MSRIAFSDKELAILSHAFTALNVNASASATGKLAFGTLAQFTYNQLSTEGIVESGDGAYEDYCINLHSLIDKDMLINANSPFSTSDNYIDYGINPAYTNKTYSFVPKQPDTLDENSFDAFIQRLTKFQTMLSESGAMGLPTVMGYNLYDQTNVKTHVALNKDIELFATYFIRVSDKDNIAFAHYGNTTVYEDITVDGYLDISPKTFPKLRALVVYADAYASIYVPDMAKNNYRQLVSLRLYEEVGTFSMYLYYLSAYAFDSKGLADIHSNMGLLTRVVYNEIMNPTSPICKYLMAYLPSTADKDVYAKCFKSIWLEAIREADNELR